MAQPVQSGGVVLINMPDRDDLVAVGSLPPLRPK